MNLRQLTLAAEAVRTLSAWADDRIRRAGSNENPSLDYPDQVTLSPRQVAALLQLLTKVDGFLP